MTPRAEHFIYQDQGTAPYTAPRGKIMVWRAKGTGVFVFAKSRRGVTAANFLRKAREKMRIEDFA